jgi:hypothetical protein
MKVSRRQRVQETIRRAAEASAKAKACAQEHLEFCAERRECLELAKRHGLTRGIAEFEQALFRLEGGNDRLRAAFKLGEQCAADVSFAIFCCVCQSV